jgi:ATP adenylyltransferase
MPYLARERRSTDCFLCQNAAADDDADNFVIWRGATAYILLNRYPYANGHLMVTPYAHLGDLEGLSQVAAQELMDLTRLGVRLLRRTFNPDGFNVGLNLGQAAGAGFGDHLHVHIVPRWSADTNFMTVVGRTRVLPEMLEDTFSRLRDAAAQERSKASDQ